MSTTLRLRIICLGNPLHSNDAVGEAVFNQLQDVDLPDDVEVIDGGIGGMTLLPCFRDCERVLLVDLVKSDDPVGSSYFIDNLPDKLADYPSPSAEHGGNIATLLTMLPIYLERIPKIDLLCMTATHVSYFDKHMAPEISRGISKLCDKIQQYAKTKTPAFHGE